MSTPSPLYDVELGEAALLTGVTMLSEAEDDVRQALIEGPAIVARMAAATVRRQCNQHDCDDPRGGRCTHPDHRRDLDYLRHCLEMLDLPGDFTPVTPEDHDRLLNSLANQPAEKLAIEPGED